MTVTYEINTLPNETELLELYGSVGWSAYTREPTRLVGAVAASLHVVTARDGEELIGLARVVGDGLTIAYLQDILVAPQYHRRGVGRELFTRAFAPFSEVRQKVLMTGDDAGQLAFYGAMGFTEVHSMENQANVFVKFLH